MSAPATLNKDRQLETAEDYQALRAQGMEMIRALSGQIWTDHNLHDPGITSLEALCYALTDLAYRTNFSTVDLLTPASGSIPPATQSGLFPAHEILPNTALTLLDFRKLLVRVDGIKNAWLSPLLDHDLPSSEIALYVDHGEKKLSLNPTDTEPRLHVNGLYRVMLELDTDLELGDLNSPLLSVDFPELGLQASLSLADDNTDNRSAWRQQNLAIDKADIAVVVDGDERLQLTLDIEGKPLPELIFDYRGSLKPTATAFINKHQKRLFSRFYQKQLRQKAAIDKAACVLHHNRNLCEDYIDIDVVEQQAISVCFDLEVDSEADIDRVKAEAAFAIEQYLNPPLDFFSLSELLAQGLSPEKIYEGPYIDRQLSCRGQAVFTKPGFVTSAGIVNSQLRRELYASDIINQLMDLDHVQAVKRFSFRLIDTQGQPMGDTQQWQLSIGEGKKPSLNSDFSKIRLFKESLPYHAGDAEFKRTLRYLRTRAEKRAYAHANESLQFPIGKHRDTLSHFPVQHDLPKVYQLGIAGLEANAGPERIQQAQQFKAYLMVFEQLLADYLAQLTNVAEQFSLSDDINSSYSSQYLTEIASQSGDFANEYYLDPSEFSDPARRNALREDQQQFLSRRNRLLDHLLARFSEQFSDYVLLMTTRHGQSIKTGKQLLADKSHFIQQFPALSRERNRAFNYRAEDGDQIWDCDNVAGISKAVSLISGIENWQRRDLAGDALFEELFTLGRVSDRHRLEIKDPGQFIIFKSAEHYDTVALALADAEIVFNSLVDADSYSTSVNSEGVFLIIAVAGISLRHDQLLASQAEADSLQQAIIDRHSQLTDSDPGTVFEALFDTRFLGDHYSVAIDDDQGDTLFESAQLFEHHAEAKQAAEKIFSQLSESSHFNIDDSGGVGAIRYAIDVDGVVLEQRQQYDDMAAAHSAIEQLIARYYQVLHSDVCDSEGFYVIEHLLLRPHRRNAPHKSRLLAPCLDAQRQACGNEDPYSFRASVILPYWPSRFRDSGFRDYMERTLRLRSPAHIHLKICWISYPQMAQLQSRYRDWLQRLATAAFNSPSLANAQNQLIDCLQGLKTVHPEAYLHDCEDDDSPSVRLGDTSLGSYSG